MAIGGGVGLAYGLIDGWIEGKRGWKLVDNGLEDASFGAITGLTDGTNLAVDLAVDASASAADETFKEGMGILQSGGCKHFEPAKIAFAGLAGLAGGFGGDSVASGFALKATALNHVLMEPSVYLAKLVGDAVVEGPVSVSSSAIDR